MQTDPNRGVPPPDPDEIDDVERLFGGDGEPLDTDSEPGVSPEELEELEIEPDEG